MAVSFPMRRLFREKSRAQTDKAIVIGFVNNMSDAALRASERQFRSLLEAGSQGLDVVVKPFFFTDIPHAESVREGALQSYSDINELWESQLDGLIVTGAEPRTKHIADETYWPSLARLIEWAEKNTISTIWSCLAAHAAVFQLSGILRQPLKRKLSGIFKCRKAQDHRLVAGLPQNWLVPHSRYNDLPETELLEKGYIPLTTLHIAGVDAFIRHKKSLFFFLQGHPEYDADSVILEYIRDVKDFMKGTRDSYPEIPLGYFNEGISDQLENIRSDALMQRNGSYFRKVASLLGEMQCKNTWRSPAVCIYRNWLRYIEKEKNKHTHSLDGSIRTGSYFIQRTSEIGEIKHEYS